MPEALKDARFLTGVTSQITDRIVTRLELENMAIQVTQTPVGGSEGAEVLRDFWGLAREGFRTTLSMNQLRRYAINPEKLLLATTEANSTGIWEELAELGIKLPVGKIESPHAQSSMSVFGHTLVAIGQLNRRREVSLAFFETPVRGRNLGHLAHEQTNWQRNIDPENIWRVIGELADYTDQALYSKNPYYRNTIQPILRAAHFFAEGEYISRETFGKAA